MVRTITAREAEELIAQGGVDVVDVRPYTTSLPDGTRWHVSDFGLTAEGVDRWTDPAWGAMFEDAFSATWTGAAESDRLNTLVLHGGLDWRRIVILRAIAMYLRQAGSAFSVEYTENALVSNPGLAATLVRLPDPRGRTCWHPQPWPPSAPCCRWCRAQRTGDPGGRQRFRSGCAGRCGRR